MSESTTPDAAAQRAMWLWVDESAPPNPARVATLAANRQVDEVFVSVGWTGPSAATIGLCDALRGRGIAVSALGGDPGWASRPADAVIWAKRAVGGGIGFGRMHLDIEPWGNADWSSRSDEYLSGLAAAVRRVATQTALPVDVDLPPWLAVDHPTGFAGIARAASRVTLMAYRDSAAAILDVSATARRKLNTLGKPYLIGVETNDVGDPTTFFEEGRAVLNQETNKVARALADDALFAAIAVHDYNGWAALA